MARNFSATLPMTAALMIVGGLMTSASAQTAPQPDSEQRAAVRDILNRAETQSQRRGLGDVLGSVTGVSRAAAQTAPPGASPSPVAVGANGSDEAVAAAGQAAPAGSGLPVAGVTGAGSPADPSMIATAPEAAADASVPASPDAAATSAPPVAVAGAEPTGAQSPTIDARGPRTVIAEGRPRHRVIASPAGHRYGAAWCAPGRW